MRPTRKVVIRESRHVKEPPDVVNAWTPTMSDEDIKVIEQVEGVLSAFNDSGRRIVVFLNPCYDFADVTDAIIALFEDNEGENAKV